MNKKSFKKSAERDFAYYMDADNDYGLLTNYVLFYFGYDAGDVEEFFTSLRKRVRFLRQENLQEDTVNFCNEFDIPYD